MAQVQEQVQETIDGLVESGDERGLQVAVYRGGEQIVDAVAGVTDPATERPVQSETVFYAYSVGKAAASTIVHILVGRGHFDYETPISEMWPEFAAHGKESATVRHVLSHTVGVPRIPIETTPEDLCDWEKMCAAIADSEPWWEPGTKMTYHAYTFGYIVGEIVRRSMEKRISEVLREEITEPLGIQDELYFGMPESEHQRLAVLEDEPGSAEFLASMPDDSPFFKLGPRATTPTAEFGNRTDILEADIPAGGKMSARAIARMYAAMMGEVDGVRLISEETLRTVSAPAYSGPDEIAGFPTTWALGYGAGRPRDDSQETPSQETPSIIEMGGVGGSLARAYVDHGISVAVNKNRLKGDFAVSEQIGRIVETLTRS